MYVHTLNCTEVCMLIVAHASSFAVLSAENVFSLICANTLWLAAIAHYVYITFLGYTSELIPAATSPL